MSTKAGKPFQRNKGKNYGAQNAQKYLHVSKRGTNKPSAPWNWPSKKFNTFTLNLPREIPTTTLRNTPNLGSPPSPFPVERREIFLICQVTKHSSLAGERDLPFSALYKTPYPRLRLGQRPQPQLLTATT